MAGSSGGSGGGGSDDPGIIALAMLGIFIFIIWIIYHFEKFLVLRLMLITAVGLLLPFYWDGTARELIHRIMITPISNFDISSVINVYSIEGALFGRWVMLAIALFFMWWIVKKGNKHSKYRQTYNIRSLTSVMSEYYKNLKPLKYVNGWDVPIDGGKWESPRTPIQWVLNNGLLFDGNGQQIDYHTIMSSNHFAKSTVLYKDGKRHPNAGYIVKGTYIDRDKTLEVWKTQMTLGLPCEVDETCSTFPSYMRTLAAALLCYAHSDKKSAWSIFDDLNDAWTPSNSSFSDGLITKADSIFKKYGGTDISIKLFDQHGYWPGVFMAGLMDAAHMKGSLSTAEFIWLRHENIVLFEILNARGGGVEWANSSMVGCQLEHEYVLGHYITNMMDKKAFAGLYRSIYAEGWVDDLPKGITELDEVVLETA